MKKNSESITISRAYISNKQDEYRLLLTANKSAIHTKYLYNMIHVSYKGLTCKSQMIKTLNHNLREVVAKSTTTDHSHTTLSVYITLT